MVEGSNESHQEITIHSENIISQSEKSYQPYVSDDRKQDHSIQQLCNKLNVTIIRVNGIAEHSKEEVEHVGGKSGCEKSCSTR